MDDRKPRSCDDLRREFERAIDPRARNPLVIFDEIHRMTAGEIDYAMARASDRRALLRGMVTNQSPPHPKP